MSETPAAQPVAERPLYYYVILDGESVGPLSTDEIAELVAAGRIGPSTRAWHEELDHWIEVGRMPELAARLPALAGLAGIEETPVQPISAQDFRFAALWQRLAAGFLDLLLFWVIVMPLFLLIPPLRDLWDPGVEAHPFFNAVTLIVSALAALYYVPPLWLGRGQTIGYLLLRIRLVDETNLGPVPLLRVIIWYVMTSVMFVGFLWFFFDAKRRMLHNLLSRTIVIRASKS